MSAIAAIAINDGATTPVTHTFNPQSTNPAAYRNGASIGSSYGLAYDEQIGITVKPNPEGLSKVDLTLVLPHDVSGFTDDGARVYEQIKVGFSFPPNATMQRRKDARVLMANLLLNSQVVDAVDNLNPPY